MAAAHDDNNENQTNLEDIGIQLVGMEAADEYLDSLNIIIANPDPLADVVTYSPPTSSESVHLSSFDEIEHIHALPVISDYIHPQGPPLVSGDILHSHSTTGDMVRCQPVSSKLVCSQPHNSHPLDSEFVHSHPVNPEQEPVNSHSHSHGYQPAVTPAFGMGLVSVTQPLSNETPASLQATPGAQSNKRRKKSIVWEHFTVETVSPGCRRACCKVCKQSFAYSNGSKVSGTSHLKRHIAKGACPITLGQQERSQLTPYMPKNGGTKTCAVTKPKSQFKNSGPPYLVFDQDRCRQDIARMIIMHNYPLHIVEHPGFISFVQNLQPQYNMVSFNTVQGDCVATFLREKQNLQKFIEGIPGRICLTLDMWTCNQSTGYVFVAGQFIDYDWKLHKRLLNVVMEPFPKSDAAFSHAIATCLSDWGLHQKLASITINQPLIESCDTGLEKLRAFLAVENPLVLNGQLMIKACIAHTLSSMAQEVLKGGRETIQKIRASVKYVKTVECHEERFLEQLEQLGVHPQKSLSLDNVTKWNTTYEMLLAAFELKQVFSCLDTGDSNYTNAPSVEDWKEVENICMLLKLLHDTASLLTTKSCPSSHVFFHEVWKIQLELAPAGTSEDIFVNRISNILQNMLHEYFKNAYLILAIAVAMDPRFKMKLVEFSFTKIFSDKAPVYIRAVVDGMHELFHEYVSTSANTENGNRGIIKVEDNHGRNHLTTNRLSDFDMYIMESISKQMKSELDQYLEESLLPRVQDFDVLGWWNQNKNKYPTLSKMARDVLSIPLSTVSAESVFDIVSKEMDSYRCSLRPETVEALICAKDWLQQTMPTISTDLVKMEP